MNRSRSRVREDYRQHTIVAAWHEGKYKGRITIDQVVVHNTEGSDIPDVIERSRKFIDEKIEVEARRAGTTPDEARVLEGMRTILPKLHDGQLAMLKAHYHAEGQEITTTELADAAGYANYSSANLHYGIIGKLLYELAPIKLPDYDDGSSPIYTFYLAEAAAESDNESNWKWKLRPEVSKAIKELGLDA
ncbi:MAG: hypothetical protein IH913_04195 [Proteobacteria bacterium]|nr:hypothetical protein [Pseudomonadota bacterium]